MHKGRGGVAATLVLLWAASAAHATIILGGDAVTPGAAGGSSVGSHLLAHAAVLTFTDAACDLRVGGLGSYRLDLVQTNAHDLAATTNCFSVVPASSLQLTLTNFSLPFEPGRRVRLADRVIAGLAGDGMPPAFMLPDYFNPSISAAVRGLFLLRNAARTAVAGDPGIIPFHFSYDALANGLPGTSTDRLLTVVPEPATWNLLWLCGLPSLLLLGRRRRARLPR